MIRTFQQAEDENTENASYISYVNTYDKNQQELLTLQQVIIKKQNHIDADALQEYLNSVRTTKTGKQRKFNERTSITYIISNMFKLLKHIFLIPQNQQHFNKIVNVYIELIKSRQNSKYHTGLLQQHLKQLIQLDFQHKNKKLFFFISKVFEINSYVIYKILQSRPEILEWNSLETLKIYDMFISFAASKKNNMLIIKQIKNCIKPKILEKDVGYISSVNTHKLDRLKILLANFPETLILPKMPSHQLIEEEGEGSEVREQQYFCAIISQIYQYLNELIHKQMNLKPKQFQIYILEIIKLFVKLPWTHLDVEGQILSKNQIIFQYLRIWKQNAVDQTIQSLLNEILEEIQIESSLQNSIKSEILTKIDQINKLYENNGQNFKFLKILFHKLGKNKVEDLLTHQEFHNIISVIFSFPLKEEIVALLDTIKRFNIYGLANYIHRQVKSKIQMILASDKQNQRHTGISEMIQPQFFNNEDRRLALKCLRKFRFEAIEVYTVLKQYVLKNHLGSKNIGFRIQVVKACLYILTRNCDFIDKNRIMREILNLINKDISLKIMTIEWFRDQESNYERKIFSIFKEPQFLNILFQDYASNHMLLKRFSIKVLCFIYPLNQCQIIPFLKRVYYHIYDRLSTEKLVSFQEKQEALSLTRQILRHRTEIIADDSASLCNFLYNDLYKCKTYEEDKQNQLLIELFKTLVDLVRKAPKSIGPYIRLICDFIIKLLNSKDEDQRVKNFALNTLNQLVRNCNYVLIPYFHFPNLYSLLREILKQGNRKIDSGQLLRLLGNLGFVNKDKYNRLRLKSLKALDQKQINFEFEKQYQETTYLKSIRNVEEPTPHHTSWIGPYLFTKEERSYSYVEIQTFKSYILAKIGKIVSQQPSKIVNYMVFKVLEAFMPIIKKQQELLYQQIIIEEILIPNQKEITSDDSFSLVSKMIRYQDTKAYHQVIIKYLIKLTEVFQQSRQYQLLQILYIVTAQYPQKAFEDDMIRKIIFYIAEKITKGSVATPYEVKLGLNVLENLANYLDNFFHLFLPQFNKIFLSSDQNICLPYFEMILTFCQKAPTSEFYLPQISESLLDLLKAQIEKFKVNSGGNITFIQKIIDFTLCLIIIYGDKFKSFVIKFRQLVQSINITHILYGLAQKYMKKNSTLNYLSQAFSEKEMKELFKHSTRPNLKKVPDNGLKQLQGLNKKTIFYIIEEFNCDKNQIQDESEEWFNKICLVLFEKSQNTFIKECLPLVKEDRSFSHDVFPLAFYFFWNYIGEDDRKKLVNKLKLILESKVISLRIKQKFIDTIYFMGQWKSPIPLKNKFLCEICTEALDLAKGLFYMENLFENDHESYGESLIKIYCQLGEKQSALGFLKIVKNLNTKTKILLYQKLKRYHEALKEYDLLPNPLKPENMEIQITIRKQMSDWESVIKLCTNQSMKNPNPTYKSNLAPLAVEAAVNLGKWDQASNWLDFMDKMRKENNERNIEDRAQRNQEENFFIWKTMLMIHQKKYREAQKYIEEARKAIYPKICQLFNFSFERSMEGVVRLQQLSELEETVAYFTYDRVIQEQDEKKKRYMYAVYKKRLESLWKDRIEGSKRNLNAMQKILMTRNLLLSKSEDFNEWLDFCRLALKQNQPQFSKKTLKMLSEELELDGDVKKKFDIETLMIEAKFILGEIKDEEAVAEIEEIIKEKGSNKSEHSICRLYENCALWLSEKQYDFNTTKGKKCLELLERTTQKIKKYIKGWHLMGLMHLKMDELLEEKNKIITKKNFEEDQANSSFLRESRQTHIFQALHCFLKSVCCGLKNHGFFLEDCLKILNLLLNETEIVGLVEQFSKYYTDIPTEGLIDIIPQIMSRLDIVNKAKQFEMMIKLLTHVGFDHPHAIVFPIVFLRKGNNQSRKKVAEDIYQKLLKKEQQKLSENPKESSRKENKKIADIFAETQKIVTELCKVSLKLNEKFRIIMYKLHEESKTLEPRIIAKKYLNICHKLIKQQTSELSLGEFGFLQQYRQELSDIINALEIFIEYNQLEFFRKAQRNLIRIYDDLLNSLKFIKKISLDEASPQLRKIKNSNVCIPGTYTPNSQNIYISSFKPELDVIDSKQRPKKLIIVGSDGKQHLFLLKGKQDLRLDERIMQLFNLINKMLHDPVEQDKYSIQGYSITPISPETGLISWVQNCDTIGSLIQDYRKSTLPASKIYLQTQQTRILSIKQPFKLPKPNKVQIYKEIQAKVSGWDLRNVFWIRSMNSEEWLKSRSTYVRSLAVMSMVGYIIGLGDRHPFNIMVQRNTGKIVHIDFGDCFDVNRMRKDFPQKVPFRLTRMLVKAMEPCGTHGIFKHTCQKIIKLLRSNKQSIVTIIEAFRYDPIISWRFKINQQDEFDENNPTQQSCLLEQQRQRQHMDSKNKINLYGNKLNFEFAYHVLNQVKKKLGGKTGNDTNKVMSVEDQVQSLIQEAESPENLVQHYEGWLIYW